MKKLKNLLKGDLVGFDTNIFIYYFQKHPQLGPKVKNIFEYLIKHKILSVTSNITLIEVLASPLSPDLIKRLEEELLNFPILKIQETTNQIASEAARIRRTYGFKMADSIQLAAALHSKAQIFITNDSRLKQFKELKILMLKEIFS